MGLAKKCMKMSQDAIDGDGAICLNLNDLVGSKNDDSLIETERNEYRVKE